MLESSVSASLVMDEVLDFVTEPEIIWHQLYHEMFDSYLEFSRLDELFAIFISNSDGSSDFADLVNETIHILDSNTDLVENEIVLFLFYEFNSRVSKDIILNLLKQCEFDVDRTIAKISAMPVTGQVKQKSTKNKISLANFLAPTNHTGIENNDSIFRKVNPNESYKSVVSSESSFEKLSTIITKTKTITNNSESKNVGEPTPHGAFEPFHRSYKKYSPLVVHDSEWKVTPSNCPEFMNLSQWRNQLNNEYGEMVNNYRQAASMYRNNQGNSCKAYVQVAAVHRTKLHNTTLWYSKYVFEKYNPNCTIEVNEEYDSLRFAGSKNELSRTVSFDLHYLFVKQVRMISLSIIFFYLDTKSVERIKFIVGKGLHSTSGICKIRKNLTTSLDSYGFKYEYDDGVVIVKL